MQTKNNSSSFQYLCWTPFIRMPNLQVLLVAFIYITSIYAKEHISKENQRTRIVGESQFSKEISAEGRFLQQDDEDEPRVSQEDPEEVRVSYDDEEESSGEGQIAPEPYPVVTPEVYPTVTPRTENAEGYPEENQEETESSEEHSEFQENYEGETEFESGIDKEYPEEAQTVLTMFGEDAEPEESEKSDNDSDGFWLNGPAR